jgi:2-iminoacetate synthase ThiH
MEEHSKYYLEERELTKEEVNELVSFGIEQVCIVVTENPYGKVDNLNLVRAFSSGHHANIYKKKIEDKYNIKVEIIYSVPEANNSKIYTEEEN